MIVASRSSRSTIIGLPRESIHRTDPVGLGWTLGGTAASGVRKSASATEAAAAAPSAATPSGPRHVRSHEPSAASLAASRRASSWTSRSRIPAQRSGVGTSTSASRSSVPIASSPSSRRWSAGLRRSARSTRHRPNGDSSPSR